MNRLKSIMYVVVAAMFCVALLVFSNPAQATAWSPPLRIVPSTLGTPTFEDNFDELDAGPDLTEKSATHRWRTISKPCVGWTVLSPKVHDCRTAGSEGLYGDSSIGMDPFRVSGGKLYINIRPLPKTHAERWGRSYLSGWLTTKFSFSQTYGYFEARIATPAGAGMWPAFWLMPTSGQWPTGGEIDITEQLGIDCVTYASVHARPNGVALHTTKKIKAPCTLTRTFHNYGLAWTPTEIVWYLDGLEIRRMSTPADVHVPMYILLNVATGGSWGGPMKVKSGRMAVDYVRVYALPQ